MELRLNKGMAQLTPRLVSTLPIELPDSTHVFDLQQVNEIAQSFSGCLESDTIARWVTAGLADRFRLAPEFLNTANALQARRVEHQGNS